jgi:NADP-dependent 3-hydroxy acid dehydrogenase YdfG
MKIGPGTSVLVTGASRGIGRATAELLADRGCTVGLVARGAEDLGRLSSELTARGATAVALPADVGDREEVEASVARFLEEAGGLDVLVANAGVAHYGPFRDLPLAEAERMTRVNWLGTVYSVGAVLPAMLDQAGGWIAIVSSGAGHRSFPWAAVYGATKFAQRGFLEALRHELSGTGVGVTGIYPAEVKTQLHDDDRAHDRMPDWYRPNAAIPPAKVAEAIVAGIEASKERVFVPPNVRLLGLVHGISPALADRVLRIMMGRTAAPAR